MKIALLHGPGEVGKRSELLKIRSHFSRNLVSIVDLKQDDIAKIEEIMLSQPLLFEGRRLVLVENAPETLDLEKLPKLAGELFLAVMAPSLKNDSLILKSAHKLGAKILLFEGEKELSAFPFLDALLEKKPQAFSELQKLLLDYGWVYVVTMIYYGLRRNLLPLPPQGFIQRKILAQRQNFHPQDFEQLYKLALQTEFNIKNGAMAEKVALAKLVQAFIG
ncbi:MAG: hypothetical protein UU73_C0002G0172 [Candidatus Daviesbacteria bacterium GW2011_GWA1_41_61]|uniref:DNA polymerase III delta N-terminal domain-containing protein n=1 Tax=Candidatus Daviesbacteria bacterium GW2011_GWA2_40_9 TaxID=1618424 RepID=A0A0G0WGL8_9BACT|nr:MAG: hypothetical protein UU26_C0009G0029 [Candidatus Daviesbacteria bacterium GW2011_GWC1_40_9]KKR83450.1 MAG: hypothetical protein UU29_C0005G0031 [Candidatus Daviesbacteria bacterium GW2011_GWA2_40_9]KKR93832.1 MAG: hypothetical protein UU44_C0001G0172 [Candidatus Daviesbacteria bacterium GW2011_GWB1_41_15]KKS15298.1 MAG: hypothetical protein UU73_C0002G0172 [Candidatus Daviesbacteria bacterium GW2011_GWA1_41_61]